MCLVSPGQDSTVGGIGTLALGIVNLGLVQAQQLQLHSQGGDGRGTYLMTTHKVYA